ncbi:hypothetical protein LJC37_01850, partial [Bacteroidales bacterium OttesenSCG-928-E04]|nr:hypothetical protein [Bacteroidales bacterium OttesenSCG-928-E04]
FATAPRSANISKTERQGGKNERWRRHSSQSHFGEISYQLRTTDWSPPPFCNALRKLRVPAVLSRDWHSRAAASRKAVAYAQG